MRFHREPTLGFQRVVMVGRRSQLARKALVGTLSNARRAADRGGQDVRTRRLLGLAARI